MKRTTEIENISQQRTPLDLPLQQQLKATIDITNKLKSAKRQTEKALY